MSGNIYVIKLLVYKIISFHNIHLYQSMSQEVQLGAGAVAGTSAARMKPFKLQIW
jgi:uncharacterized membrane protein